MSRVDKTRAAYLALRESHRCGSESRQNALTTWCAAMAAAGMTTGERDAALMAAIGSRMGVK